MSHLVANPSPVSKPTKTVKGNEKPTTEKKGKQEAQGKQEKQEKQVKQEERAVNPMTMVPAEANISRRAPLPPKAERLKRLYGF